MKRSGYTDQQIAFTLHQGELGTSVGEIARKMGIAGSYGTNGIDSDSA